MGLILLMTYFIQLLAIGLCIHSAWDIWSNKRTFKRQQDKWKAHKDLIGLLWKLGVGGRRDSN